LIPSLLAPRPDRAEVDRRLLLGGGKGPQGAQSYKGADHVPHVSARCAGEGQSDRVASSRELGIFRWYSLTRHQMKAVLAGNDAISSEAAGAMHVENFALKVFMSADNDDRAGITGK
jgi:hypothetical protein